MERRLNRKRRYILLVVGVPVGLAVFAAYLGLSIHRVPSYGGKSADEWFFGHSGHPGREKTMNAAQAAFLKMGTNSIPFLMRKMEQNSNLKNDAYGLIYAHVPTRVKKNWNPAIETSYVQKVAGWHIRNLGSMADPMAVEILKCVQQIQDDEARAQAFHAVRHLARSARGKEFQKEYYLSLLNDPVFEIRYKAAIAMANVDPSFKGSIPFLELVVTNENFVKTAITSRWAKVAGPAFSGARINSYDMVKTRRKNAYAALMKVSPSNSVPNPDPPPYINPSIYEQNHMSTSNEYVQQVE